jgi:8-oxo-dGTP pyrophosphatase MutT (NUDIX family)
VNSDDIRPAVAELVRGVHPFDQREAADQADILDWAASGEPLLRTLAPDTPPKHLVVYFIPVDSAERCLLLGDHRKSGLWLPPGGHVEDGEDPRQAVIREAREELGIEAQFKDDQPCFLTVTPTRGPNRHLDVDLWFLLDLARQEAQLTPDPREFSSVRWFEFGVPRDWPADIYDPEMHRFAAKLGAAVVRW